MTLFCYIELFYVRWSDLENVYKNNICIRGLVLWCGRARARPQKTKSKIWIAKDVRGKRASGASNTSGRWAVQWGFNRTHPHGKLRPVGIQDFEALTARGKDNL